MPSQYFYLKLSITVLSLAIVSASYQLLKHESGGSEAPVLLPQQEIHANTTTTSNIAKIASKSTHEAAPKMPSEISKPLAVSAINTEEASKNSDPELLALSKQVTEKLANREVQARDAALVFSTENGWYIQPEVIGKKLSDKNTHGNQIAMNILQKNLDPTDDRNYVVAYEAEMPKVQASDLQSMLSQAQNLSTGTISVLKHGKSLIDIDLSQEADKWFKPDYQTKTMVINQDTLRAFVADFEKKHVREPGTIHIQNVQESKSEYNQKMYKKVVTDGPAEVGWSINTEKLQADLLAALSNPEQSEIHAEFIKIPLNIVSDIPGLEFPDLLSEGFSDFSLGHGDERTHNVELGVSTVSMALIDPGETFSINSLLGWITYDKGYQDALVLFGSGVAKAPGGGLCQVSTTLYRAALYAGFPIIERLPHSWDVAYYRDLYGLDATIYPPLQKDLRFKNDSPGPVLIHGYLDKVNQTAYFDFYGTSDGRQVVINFIDKVFTGGKSKQLRNEQIITYPDGSTVIQKIVSWYRQ